MLLCCCVAGMNSGEAFVFFVFRFSFFRFFRFFRFFVFSFFRFFVLVFGWLFSALLRFLRRRFDRCDCDGGFDGGCDGDCNSNGNGVVAVLLCQCSCGCKDVVVVRVIAKVLF